MDFIKFIPSKLLSDVKNIKKKWLFNPFPSNILNFLLMSAWKKIVKVSENRIKDKWSILKDIISDTVIRDFCNYPELKL